MIDVASTWWRNFHFISFMTQSQQTQHWSAFCVTIMSISWCFYRDNRHYKRLYTYYTRPRGSPFGYFARTNSPHLSHIQLVSLGDHAIRSFSLSMRRILVDHLHHDPLWLRLQGYQTGKYLVPNSTLFLAHLRTQGAVTPNDSGIQVRYVFNLSSTQSLYVTRSEIVSVLHMRSSNSWYINKTIPSDCFQYCSYFSGCLNLVYHFKLIYPPETNSVYNVFQYGPLQF